MPPRNAVGSTLFHWVVPTSTDLAAGPGPVWFLDTSSPTKDLQSRTGPQVHTPALPRPRLSMYSPRLPWEVIERTIDHSRGHPKTLRSLAITCRQLLPRTRLVMFAHVRFESRDHVFAFVDFLRRNPGLQPAVYSIAVWPPDLAPIPLLRILPSLSKIEFTSKDQEAEDLALHIHQSSLTCFQLFGTHIQTLCLSRLDFETPISFARLLLTFVNVTHLTCSDIQVIETPMSNGEPPILPEATRRRLFQQIRLEALTVDYKSIIAGQRATPQGQLLLDSSLASSTISNLTLTEVEDVFLAVILSEYRCDWLSIRSLVLQLPGKQLEGAKEALGLLKALPPKRLPLTDITLEWEPHGLKGLRYDLSHNGVEIGNGTYEELEHALLAFSHPRIIFTLTCPLSTNNSSIWLHELGKHLPVLSQRGALTLQSRCKDNVPPVGHDGEVRALAISPDSKWVASGSDDSTIILWDTEDGMISQQWVAHSYKRVLALAFSPDGQYLLSGGYDNSAAIWDLSRGARKVTTLEGHTMAVSPCIWSPDGKTVATGSSDWTIRLWDTDTFQQRALHPLTGEISRLAFSPDGRWLACVSDRCECSILNIPLGTLHQTLSGQSDPSDTPRSVLAHAIVSAAFHPESMRLAIASYGRGPRINVLDLETGSPLLPWDGEAEKFAEDISFSPDGSLLLEVVGNTCYIWDGSTGIELFRLQGHRENITAARFSPCGKYIASASWDETVQVWRTSDGSCLATLSEHKDAVEHVAFSPDGKTLASGSRDRRVIIRRTYDVLPPTNR